MRNENVNDSERIASTLKQHIAIFKSRNAKNNVYFLNLAKVFANKNRLSLIYLLSLIELNVKELEMITGFQQPALAIYLQKLATVNLINVTKDRVNYYSLKSTKLINFLKRGNEYQNLFGIGVCFELDGISRDEKLEELRLVYNKKQTQDGVEKKAKIYGLVSHFDRAIILFALNLHSYNVGELQQILQVSQPAVSQNLKKLQKMGLIRSEKVKQTIYYSLDIPSLDPLFEYLESQVPSLKEQMADIYGREF